MKFICNKQELLKSINTVIRASSSNFQKSILECIHMEATENKLILEATDMMIYIKDSIFAEIADPGSFAIPSRLLQEIINKFPEGEVTFERSSMGIEINCRNSNVRLQEMNAEEFPVFPEMKDSVEIVLKENQFRKMINGTVFSTYTGEDKPIFTGILVESEGDTLNVVGIDGIRLALRSTEYHGIDTLKAVVPSKAMREAARIFEDTDGEIRLSVNDRAFMMIKDETYIYTQLLEGDYIKYRSIIPTEYNTRVRIEVQLFERALERVAILARNDSSNLIKLTVKQDEMVINSNSEYGTAQEEIPIFTEGNQLTIAFNVKYLLDVLKNVEDTEVFLEFNGKLKPCVMKPVEGNGFLYLVVPVNVRE